MYICKSCGEHFDDPDVKKEYTGVSSEGYHEYFEVGHCPYCGSDDIEEAEKCRICGEWFYSDGKEFCNNCLEDLSKELYGIQAKYTIDFETLQDWIGDYFEW